MNFWLILLEFHKKFDVDSLFCQNITLHFDGAKKTTLTIIDTKTCMRTR